MRDNEKTIESAKKQNFYVGIFVIIVVVLVLLGIFGFLYIVSHGWGFSGSLSRGD